MWPYAWAAAACLAPALHASVPVCQCASDFPGAHRHSPAALLVPLEVLLRG
jgi:hypothetical protein